MVETFSSLEMMAPQATGIFINKKKMMLLITVIFYKLNFLSKKVKNKYLL